MKTYTVSLWQEIGGTLTVKAKNTREAKKKAIKKFEDDWKFEKVVHQDCGVVDIFLKQ